MNNRLLLTGLITLLLVSGCGKESVQQVSPAQMESKSQSGESVSKESPNNETQTVSSQNNNTDKMPGSALVEDQQKTIEKISKNNKMTEEEMLKIAHEVVVENYKKYYTLKSEEEVTNWVNASFLDPSMFLDSIKKEFNKNKGKIKSAEVISENERVSVYGENGFTFKTRMTCVEHLTNGETNKQILEEQFVIRKDNKDGKFKISASNGVEVPQ